MELITGDRRSCLRVSPEILDPQPRKATAPRARTRGSLTQVRVCLFMGHGPRALHIQGDAAGAVSFQCAFGLA